MIENIPLIIPNFNQLSYLRNLVNQFHFYYPENQISIIDNGSNYNPLMDYYDQIQGYDATIYRYPTNNFVGNLKDFLERTGSEYYIISDPDISIHPTTPPNFLEVFKAIIDSGVHHVGFDLIYSDIPEWNKKAGWITGDEKALHTSLFTFTHDEKTYSGFRAPLDTTFTMFKKSNSGWTAPMASEHWDNSVRMFNAQHLTWYLSLNHLNEEMINYFSSCRKRTENDVTSAGVNHFRPE